MSAPGRPVVGSPFQTAGHFQTPSPVLLASSCDVIAGNNATPRSDQMTYVYRKPIIIEEIRWALRLENPDVLMNLGAFVYVKMQFGHHYLMRDPVPIWLLGTTMAMNQEQANDTLMTSDDSALSYFRWRLPEPLYLPAGERLRSQFSRAQDGLGSISVHVSYAGRTVAPNQRVPRIVPIPYAAPFVTTIGNTYQQSNENHLFNPFDVPMKVQRLTGRVLTSLSSVPARVTEQSLTPGTVGTALTVQVFDSWGKKMVNDRTGPGDVFDCLRAAWTVDTVLPAKGQYDVRAWNIPTGASAQQLHVGMIGFREEAL